ncbi:DUF1127 domain-containing protein [Pukyongiella litopenaei]|uniref:DUF1127 domain-containing protein n=1 Tax=Pukyongiella litopenaei TaxID=2605946 RepID=A0A2S0MUR7_9RHOB|nr:DUF1127 domain-containing protein [Pukyongiella litopenaei]AVO39636.1 DUF1127 domain-containing protein [Pukyongiella litopenaei]
MAALDTTRTVYVSHGLIGRIGAALSGTVAAVVAWNDARVTRKVLLALTDRQLEDIGLVRGDVDLIARVRDL